MTDASRVQFGARVHRSTRRRVRQTAAERDTTVQHLLEQALRQAVDAPADLVGRPPAAEDSTDERDAQLSGRIPSDLRRRVRVMAAEHGWDVQDVVEQALLHHLDL